MRVRFLLACEGSSDTSLVAHIERMLIACGASEADGSAFAEVLSPGGPLEKVASWVRFKADLESALTRLRDGTKPPSGR